MVKNASQNVSYVVIRLSDKAMMMAFGPGEKEKAKQEMYRLAESSGKSNEGYILQTVVADQRKM